MFLVGEVVAAASCSSSRSLMMLLLAGAGLASWELWNIVAVQPLRGVRIDKDILLVWFDEGVGKNEELLLFQKTN